MRLEACVFALITAVCAATTLAQRPDTVPAARTGGEPTFRSRIDLAQVDVVVTDDAGEPVAGLTTGDFALFENGVPRPITAFEPVHVPDDANAAAPGISGFEADVSANGEPPGRIYVFALDVVAPCDALRARHLLRQFLEQHFGPRDVASVVVVGPGLASDGQDFTRSRRLLLEAIDKYSGGFARACERRYTPPRPLSAGRSQQMASLRTLTESLALIPGRKTVLLFTQSLDVDMLDVVDYSGGVLGLAGEDAHAVLRAATRGSVAIYPIDPAGLTTEYTPLKTLDSFAALARATGGSSLINSNSLPQLFARIAGESGTYYRLGFDSGYDRENGRYVKLRVDVTRPGLTVRAREGYVAPSREEARAERDARRDSAVAAALGAPVSTGGVPVRVAAAPFRAAGRHAAVDVVVEVDARSLPLAEKSGRLVGDLELRYVVTTEREKSYPEFRYTTRVDRAGRPASPWTSGGMVRVVSTLTLPPGRHQLRVAAGNGATAGSVVHDLEVPDFRSRPYTLAGVLVSTRAARGIGTIRTEAPTDVRMRASRCRPPFCRDGSAAARGHLLAWRGPTAAATPDARPDGVTTAREFTRADTLELYTEVYDNRNAARRGPPDLLVVIAELRDADGTLRRSVVQERGVSARPAHVINVPLKGMADGSYVVRVTLASRSNDDRPVARAFPIRILGPGGG